MQIGSLMTILQELGRESYSILSDNFTFLVQIAIDLLFARGNPSNLPFILSLERRSLHSHCYILTRTLILQASKKPPYLKDVRVYEMLLNKQTNEIF